MSSQLPQILNDFEAFLLNANPNINSFHPHYHTAVWEMLQNGGKRFRPALIFCVVDALSPQLIHNAFLPALSLECIHTYSLIHDDLPCMDNAPLRRGHPTLHTKYGQTLALLIGDGLNTYAFALLSQAKLDPHVRLELIHLLALNAGISGMVLGQTLDCEFENQRLSLEQLKTIHTNKTAKLIATALKFGALIANADSILTQKLYDIGLELGLYFQLRDDIIDACVDSQSAGKTTQNDGNKNSYVNLLGLNEAKKLYSNSQTDLKKNLELLPLCIQENLNAILTNYFKDVE